VIKALESIEYLEASQEHSANLGTITTGINQTGSSPKNEQKHVYSSPKSQAAIEERWKLGYQRKIIN